MCRSRFVVSDDGQYLHPLPPQHVPTVLLRPLNSQVDLRNQNQALNGEHLKVLHLGFPYQSLCIFLPCVNFLLIM